MDEPDRGSELLIYGRVRSSVARSVEKTGVIKIAKQFGLESTMNSRGRPKKIVSRHLPTESAIYDVTSRGGVYNALGLGEHSSFAFEGDDSFSVVEKECGVPFIPTGWERPGKLS